MKQVYRTKGLFTVLSAVFGFVILFFLLHPSTRPFLPFPSEDKISRFLEDSSQSKRIDPQSFWELREFTAPGTFRFEREGFLPNTIQKDMSVLPFKLDLSAHYPFLVFQSSRWHSIEFLTSNTSLPKEIFQSCGEYTLRTETELICWIDDKSMLIAFVKPISEMKKANAFFDFAGRDGEIVKDKFWLAISVLHP